MKNKQHFRKIDFLRGIAILTVFVAHFLWYYYPDYAGLIVADSLHPEGKVLLLNFLPRVLGWSGVTMMILISGFLLHLGRLKEGERFTLRGFYSRRFWRLYPPYLLVLVVFSLFLEKAVFASWQGWETFLLHVFSLQNLYGPTYFSVNPTFWCLALEVQVYGLYIIFLLGRRKWGVKGMVGFVFLLSIVWQVIGLRVDHLADSLIWVNSAVSLWIIWAAGAFLAETFYQGRRLPEALGRRGRLVLFGGFVLAACVVPLNVFLQYLSGLIGVFLLDLFLHAGKITLQGWPARLIIVIGLCSYSVFLIHQPLVRIITDFFNNHFPVYRGHRVGNGAVAALIILGISYVMYLFVELPSIRLGGRLRKDGKPPLTV